MHKRVYILGAGCSAGQPPDGPGYPMAREFVSALEQFGRNLGDREDCKRLKRCVENSAALLRQEAAQTLDMLAARLGAEAHDLGNGLTNQQRQDRHRQIYDAKIATAALFMHLEKRAKESGLFRYHNFLDELFGNSTAWVQAATDSKDTVLTFNYDRLFEMAFISRFKPDTGTLNLYGKSLLNAGMDYVNGRSIEVTPNRFAFLKLHGSVGIRAREEKAGEGSSENGPQHYTYYDGLPGETGKVINDALFFAHATDINPFHRDPEPLIVFPHEKPFVAAGSKTLLPFRGYVHPIWNEAKRRIAEATEIWTIGYRFAPIDRGDVLGLLKSAGNCRKLTVQNRMDSTEEICQSLRKKWFEPANIELKVEPYPFPF